MIKSVTHTYVRVISIDNLHTGLIIFSMSVPFSLCLSICLFDCISHPHSQSIPPSHLCLALSPLSIPLSLPPSTSLSQQYCFILLFYLKSSTRLFINL